MSLYNNYTELYKAFREHPFWNYELTEIYETICGEQYPDSVDKYKGAYPANKFPESILDYTSQCFIINTNIDNKDDLGHWCAFYTYGGKIARDILFFDPAGAPLLHVNASWYRVLKELGYKIHDSLSSLQNGLTNTCGVWCVFQLLDNIAKDIAIEGDTRFATLVRSIETEKDVFDLLVEYFGVDKLSSMVCSDNMDKDIV